MDGPVRREPAAGKLFGYEQPREPDIFLKRKLGWQGDLDLAGKLRVQPLFVEFDAVPEFLRSRHRLQGMAFQKGLCPGRCAVRNGDFRVQYIALVDIAESLAGALVLHARRAPVGGGVDRVPARPPRNHLRCQVVYRHAVQSATSRNVTYKCAVPSFGWSGFFHGALRALFSQMQECIKTLLRPFEKE
jgi:hypothetical protein